MVLKKNAFFVALAFFFLYGCLQAPPAPPTYFNQSIEKLGAVTENFTLTAEGKFLDDLQEVYSTRNKVQAVLEEAKKQETSEAKAVALLAEAQINFLDANALYLQAFTASKEFEGKEFDCTYWMEYNEISGLLLNSAFEGMKGVNKLAQLIKESPQQAQEINAQAEKDFAENFFNAMNEEATLLKQAIEDACT